MPSKEANESQKHVRRADTRNLRCNATVRKLVCSVAWELSFSVFCELRCRFLSLRYSLSVQFHVFHSLSLITFLGDCGCQFPWCPPALIHLNLSFLLWWLWKVRSCNPVQFGESSMFQRKISSAYSGLKKPSKKPAETGCKLCQIRHWYNVEPKLWHRCFWLVFGKWSVRIPTGHRLS
jgi:hypothetical protein